LACFEDWNDEGILFCYPNTLSFVTPFEPYLFSFISLFWNQKQSLEIQIQNKKKREKRKREEKIERKIEKKGNKYVLNYIRPDSF